MYLPIQLRANNNNNQIKTLIRNLVQTKMKAIVQNKKAKVKKTQVIMIVIVMIRIKKALIKVKAKIIRAKMIMKVIVVLLNKIVHKIQ